MKTGIAIAIALLLAPSMACAQERNSLAMDLGTNPAAANAFQGNKTAKAASPAIDITLGGEFALPPENDALTHPESEATAANL